MIGRGNKRALNGLLATALAGCAPVPVPTPPAASGAPTPTPAPSATPTPAASATPAASGATVSGRLYDLDGQPLTGASVRVHSLEAAVPFDRTVEAPDGHYQVAGLPVGANLEVLASKAGYGTRRRVGAFSQPSTLDFGGEAAAAYFLTDRPEVVMSEPTPDGLLADRSRLKLVLGLNVPLDAENQLRFKQALRVLPADDRAQGTSGGAVSIAQGDDAGYPRLLDLRGVGAYRIKSGTIFRNDATSSANLSWSEDGRTATFTFGGPLLTNRSADPTYQIALEAGTRPIVDVQGRQLGTAADGSFAGYPNEGQLVPGVFVGTDPHTRAIPGLAAGSREARWAATHDDAGRFRVAKDGQAPKVTYVEIGVSGRDSRIAITFDEPLAAYDNLGGDRLGTGLAATAANLAHFSFAVATRRNELASLALNGEQDIDVWDPRAKATFGEKSDRLREFRFEPAAFVADRAGAAVGSVTFELDPKDPRRVLIYILGRGRFLDPEVSEIAWRSEGIADPAGNEIYEVDADKQVYRGTL